MDRATLLVQPWVARTAPHIQIAIAIEGFEGPPAPSHLETLFAIPSRDRRREPNAAHALSGAPRLRVRRVTLHV
jgi:hypothetical protein